MLSLDTCVELVQVLWWYFGLHGMEDDSRTQYLQISQH